MSQSHEVPSRQALRQRELQSYHTLFIGRQLRIEEGGLVEILTHLYLLCALFFSATHAFANSLIGIVGNSGFRHHHLLIHHIRFFHHHHIICGGTTQALACHHSATSEAVENTIIIGWIDIVIETAELEILDRERRPTSGA